MTATADPRITPAATAALDALIALWRADARENLRLGFTDLARDCETRASNLEWEQAPCDS
jgi:hypothetical protein